MKIKNFLQKNFKTFLKYSLVGASGTIIDVAGYTWLIHAFGLNLFAAATLSFSTAVVNNYTWNKLWTYHDSEEQVTRQFGKFLVVSLLGLALNLTFLWIFTQMIASALRQADPAALPAWANVLVKLGASGMVLIYNFLANTFWTFRRPSTYPLPRGRGQSSS